MMNVLVVTAHPRPESLTGRVTQKVTEGLTHAGHGYEILDLYAENFNPLVYPADEPDYRNPDKVYSEQVMVEMERIRKHDAIIFVFPVWWHSIPAILKGYIDRVFNYGFAYGPAKLPVEKIRWIALAGEDRNAYKKRGYHLMIEHHLNIGIAGYVGVLDSEVHILYNSLSEGIADESAVKAHYEKLLSEVYSIGKEL